MKTLKKIKLEEIPNKAIHPLDSMRMNRVLGGYDITTDVTCTPTGNVTDWEDNDE